jgi:PAS domain S-box-containing protein
LSLPRNSTTEPEATLPDRLRAVAAAAPGVVGAASPAALREALEAAARPVLPFDALALLGYDPASDRLWDLAKPGPSGDSLLSGTAWEPVVRGGRPLRTEALQGDERPRGEARTGSALLAPIRAGGEMLGVLAFERAAPDGYTEEDEAVAEGLAALAAAPLAGLRLAEERRAAEHARQTSETRFRAMFEQFPLSVQIFDPEGEALAVNRAWEALFKLPPEAIRGSNPLRDPLFEPIRDYLQRGFSGERVTIPPHPFDPSPLDADPQGTRTRWLEVIIWPVHGPAGEVQEVIFVHRDVTEQHEAEAALKRAHGELEARVEARTVELAQAEARFRAIVEASPTPLLLSRLEDGVVLYANERLEALIGVEPGSLAGRRTPDFYYDPSDRPQIIGAVREQGYIRDFELRIKRADGTPRWVSLSSQRLLFNGVPTIATALVDVTERREATEALHERTQELEAVFQALPDLYFRMEADGTIRDYRAGRSFGLYVPPDAFLGRPMQEVLPAPAGPRIGEAIAEVARTGDLVAIEYALPIGTEHRDYEARLLPLSDTGQVVAVVRDVTEQKRGEEALRASEESYRGLFDNLTELVYIQDLEGRFLNVNDAVVRAYGYARPEFVGKTPAFLGAPGTVDPEAFAATFARAVAGEPQRFEWWGMRKDGSIFPKEVTIQRSTYFGEDVVIAVARDVTAQKAAEAALQKSEEHFRSLIENASDIITIVNAEGIVRYQSSAVTRVLGYAQEELNGQSVFAYLPPEDLAPTVERLQRVVADPGTPVTAEFRFRHKDGSWRYFEGIGKTLSPTSADEGVVVNSRDITERKAAEAALRESEALKRGIVEAALDCVITIDGEGHVLEFNPASEQTFGYRADEVLGRKLVELIVPPHLRAAHAAGLARYRETGEPHVLGQRIEVPAVRADGTEFPVELAIHEVPLEGGRAVFTAYLRDISERKQAEAALRASEEHFRRLIENASDIITIIGPDGISRYQSPSFERILGYKPEERTGTQPFELMHPDDVTGAREVLVRMLQEPGVVGRTKFRYRHKDGSWRVFEATGRTLLPDSAEAGVVINSRDVTEREEAEAALRRSEEHFRRLIENASDMIIVIGPAGALLYASPSTSRLLGWTPEEVAGGGGLQHIHPDDLPAVVREMERIAADPAATAHLEYRFRHKDGTWRHLDSFGKRLDPADAEAGIVFNVRDVTERVAAGAELARQRAYFEEILNSIDAGIAVFDAEGRHEYVSPKAMPDPEVRRWMIGMNMAEYARERGLPPEISEPRQRSLDEAIATRRPNEFEQTIQAPSGRTRVMLRRLLPVLDEAGAVERLIGYSVDITERVEAEREVRFQKTLLEAEGEASIDGILVVSEEGQILSYNARFVELWGIPPEVVEARSDEGAIRSVLDQVQDPEAFRARVAYLYAHPDEVARDEIALRDGRVFDRYSAPVRSSDGERYGRIWFFRDVTPQKRYAEELEKARQEASRYAASLEASLEELRATQVRLVHQEKMASLGRLTAGVAHELRNPLNFVNNFAQLNLELVADLQNALAESDAEAARETAADVEQNTLKIHEHGQRASAILQGMTEHARIAPEDRGQQRRPVDLNALVEEQAALAAEAHRQRAPARPARLVQDYGADVGTVEVVSAEISRVVQNLLSNAFDAVEERAAREPPGSPYEPTVTVRTRREEGGVVVTVTDNGAGIAEAVRDRVFEPFFTTKPPGSGHPGLGLSLAYDAVTHGYGGSLTAEGAEGDGATFRLRLPVHGVRPGEEQ